MTSIDDRHDAIQVSNMGAAPGIDTSHAPTGAISGEPDTDIAGAGTEMSPTADEVDSSPLPLLELIDLGDIDSPEAPLSWQDWTQWRAREGRRPAHTPAFSQR